MKNNSPRSILVTLIIFAILLCCLLLCDAARFTHHRELLQGPLCANCVCCTTLPQPSCCRCDCAVP
ncbi:hypothetical protein ACSBR2_042955 [Camellia fascicularis]